MDKIKMTTPLVEMDGDEMTRILWKMIKDELLLPFIDLNTEYYDLGLEYRNETDDKITFDSAYATLKHKAAVKCATITPNADRVKEYNLKETKTPKGFLTISDQTFIASSEDVSLEIKEQPRLINIQVNKLDAKTKQLIKDKNFEFTLYTDPECTKSLTSIFSHDGIATFKSLRFAFAFS